MHLDFKAFILALSLLAVGCAAPDLGPNYLDSDSPVPEEWDTTGLAGCQADRPSSLLPTTLGMDYDCDVSAYTLHDSVLDRVASLERISRKASWYRADVVDDPAEAYRWTSTLLMYIDKDLPSSSYFPQLESMLTNWLLNAIGAYYIDSAAFCRYDADCQSHRPSDRASLIASLTGLFDRVGAEQCCRDKSLGNSYIQLLSSHFFIMLHKVYEDRRVATYQFETSQDYNSSSGNPFRCRYLTFDKRTGRLLTTEDLIEGLDQRALGNRLYYCHSQEYLKRWGDPLGSSTFNYLSNADGCAVVDGGLLFYYYPYNLGCGAEGQYDLIVKPF